MMIWSDFEFVIHLACIIKTRILDIIWPCLLIIMIMTWLFEGILFICALVVSFAARALNIPSKSYVIPLLFLEWSGEIWQKSDKYEYPMNSLKKDVFLPKSKSLIIDVRKQISPRQEVISRPETASQWDNGTSWRQWRWIKTSREK